MFTEDMKRVVLIKKNKPEWQKGLLNGVGGHVEEFEFSENAMIREFEEETGIKTVTGQWYNFALMTGEKFDVDCYFCVSNSALFAASMTEEEVTVPFVNHLSKDQILSNISWLLGLCLDKDIKRIFTHVSYRTES